MKQVTENAVYQRFKKGDHQAFQYLFQKYYQPLFLFACKFVDEELAKDFVQDCFYNLWLNRKKTEIRTSLSTYLFSIIKNRCYKYLKDQQKKSELLHSIGFKLKFDEFQYFTNSEKSILEFDLEDRIEKVISNLPEKCCEVFKESRFKGSSNKEIAQKYGISVKAVEKQISKALKYFREEFKDILLILITLLILKK